MLEKKLEVSKGTGLGFANLIRMVLIESSQNIKPIGFSISDGSNMYRPSENIKDTVSLPQKLTDLNYLISDNVELPFAQTYRFKGKLTSDDLCNSDVNVLEKGVVLLENFDANKELAITIVFNRGSGFCSSEKNRQILESIGMDTKSFSTISSRYCDVEVATSVREDLDKEVVTLRISSKSQQEETKFSEAIKSIQGQLAKI